VQTTDDVVAGVDLSDRVALVTGATSGLGLETSRALASAGALVVLAARDPAKTDRALQGLQERVPDGRFEVLGLDLADLASVRRAGAEVVDHHPRLHLLVNNAGVMFTPFERTADGFELQLGTNHLGHFVLTQALVPALVAAAPARVVNLSSAGHTMSDIHWDDPSYEQRPYDKFEAYGQSKTANILFTIELERRLGPQGVHAYAVHPGVVATDLARHMSREDMQAFVARRAPKTAEGGGGLPPLQGVETGAATTVWAAVAAELGDRGGAYLADCDIAECAPYARDPDAAARLWTLSEQLVADAGGRR
jgi:NAD(P)-dependent dehydrogenase (short-subunit alcohol dehydrogenase family)